MKNMKKGYIIYSVDCKSTLMRVWAWKDADTETEDHEDYVFSLEEVEKIRRFVPRERWSIQPVYMREATWSEEEGTTITGQLERFWRDE
jgi:hypothetical protein